VLAARTPASVTHSVSPVEGAVRRRPAARNEVLDRAVGRKHVDARRDKIGHIETPVRAYLHAIQDGIVARHPTEILNRSVDP